MSFYQKIFSRGSKFMSQATLFKYGYNLSPMYRRSTARITSVSDDIMNIKIKLPINYKNKNYVGSIFGGSMFSAVDPIPMVQILNLLGEDYIVWDKAAEIKFKRPARVDLYADFSCTSSEILNIKDRVVKEQEVEIEKITQLKNKEGDVVFCEVSKTIYITTKKFYKNKRNRS
jgi:acyl-coenzyme A thioesterase PaaI-like protein